MQALNPRLDLAAFFDRLRGARERVLLLDYDGTLAPFHRRGGSLSTARASSARPRARQGS